MKANENEIFVYVGSYADKSSPGIYLFSFQAETGVLTLIESYSNIANPSFLTLDPKRNRLYSVSETAEGSVVSYTIDPESGKLAYLNEQPTLGADPCYVMTDSQGKRLYVTNYSSGNICHYPLSDEGIGAMTEKIDHIGISVRPDRQEAAHPHSIVADRSESYLFAPDLGMDRIVVYRTNSAGGALVRHDAVPLKSGAGPRHFAFHPSGRFGYVINELDSTVTAFAYDGGHGSLAEIQTISTLPADFAGESWCADIHISADGRFLYGSNRGHDSIAVYSIDAKTGELSPVQFAPTGGSFPRNFALMPNGKFLIAANQNTDSLVTYEIDGETGRLRQVGEEVRVGKPVCVQAWR